MAMKILPAVVLVMVVVLGALGFRVLDQDKRIERLSQEVKALRAAPEAVRYDVVTAQAPVPRPVEVRETAQAPATAPAAPAPRAAVTRDEVARVESAVLSLLETDHPELRDKLRAVVQEQQQSLEQAEREERRERWIARNEARLLELGTKFGVSGEQRQTLSNLLLATRDQISDVRQSAQTPEQITTVREKVRAIRDQADAQVRELLSPQQYEAFQEQFGDDDDRPDRRRARNPP
jgi:hypothetical protein